MKRQHPRNPHENRRTNSFLLSVQQEAAEYHTASPTFRRSKPTVRVNICGVSREFIVDSGSNVSLIQPGSPTPQHDLFRSDGRRARYFGRTGCCFLSTIGTAGTRFVFVPSQRNFRDGFFVGNESLFRYWKTRAQVAETSDVKSRFFEPENTWSQR